jgi:hypothetical protein
MLLLTASQGWLLREIKSQRGIAWHFSDSLSLREFEELTLAGAFDDFATVRVSLFPAALRITFTRASRNAATGRQSPRAIK